MDPTLAFSGRRRDIDLLSAQLDQVRESGRGRTVVMTGRRRVGKSRLVQEFCDHAAAPYILFQATRGRDPSAERAGFLTSIIQSDLPRSGLAEGVNGPDWNHALRALASAAPDDRPSVVVIDEVPWLIEQDPEFAGALRMTWDRHLSTKPILLILIGGDPAVMTALRDHDRPFRTRTATMTVRPLHLADVADMTGLDAADAVDALLITGGFPEIVASWRPGMSRAGFLRKSLSNPLSPLLMAGMLTFLGEFPQPSRSRAVLEAIGTGERTFSAIARAAGGREPLPSGTLSPLLAELRTKEMIADELPLSTASDTRNRRYRIADPYLRFWLGHLRHAIPLIDRGRSDVAFRQVEESWQTWRGRAVEPIVRDSLAGMLPNDHWPDTEAIGAWWNRQNNPEVDLIGADRSPTARQTHFVGSIKWLDDQPFDHRDHANLSRALMAVPGATPDTPLIAVSRDGAVPHLLLAAVWTPDDLLNAWR